MLPQILNEEEVGACFICAPQPTGPVCAVSKGFMTLSKGSCYGSCLNKHWKEVCLLSLGRCHRSSLLSVTSVEILWSTAQPLKMGRLYSRLKFRKITKKRYYMRKEKCRIDYYLCEATKEHSTSISGNAWGVFGRTHGIWGLHAGQWVPGGAGKGERLPVPIPPFFTFRILYYVHILFLKEINNKIKIH